jgi:hypothetical protein
MSAKRSAFLSRSDRPTLRAEQQALGYIRFLAAHRHRGEELKTLVCDDHTLTAPASLA